MTKDLFTFIFSFGTGRCDGCRRNFEGRYFFLTWQHSEHSNQCIKDFTEMKKLPEVIAFCPNCRWDFINCHIGEYTILSCSPPLPQALSFIKAKDQIGKEFYKMIKEGKSQDEALSKVCSRIEATFLPPPKRHIEEKRMKKREAREIGKVEQETLVKARRKWELRRIAEERGMKTQVPKHAIEERKSMINESFEKPKESMINDSLEKRKKKRVFEKIFSSIGIKEGNWVTMMIQFILHSLYGLVIVVVFGVVLNKISLSAYLIYKRILLFILGLVRNFILTGIGNIFLFLITPFILLLIFAVILWIGSRGYYLVKGIGRFLFQIPPQNSPEFRHKEKYGKSD